jgi:hypothetical protein
MGMQYRLKRLEQGAKLRRRQDHKGLDIHSNVSESLNVLSDSTT